MIVESDRPPVHPFAAGLKLLPVLTPDRIIESLQGAASWLESATETARGKGPAHRNAVYSVSGEVTWMYPHSNTGEVISGWLDLAEILKRSEYRQYAVQYATDLLEDPVKGIYQGEHKEAHGLAWYWADRGTYTCGYSMRMPAHFARLYQIESDARFLEICEVIGRTFLARQVSSGLVDAQWSPWNGWKEGGTRIGSRYVYPVATFATLFELTSQSVYQDAYERAVEVLLFMQNEDGSFHQHYDIATGAPCPIERSIKPHFFSYIFNAIIEAFAIFPDERLLQVAERLGDYIVRVHHYRRTVPYCLGEKMLPTDQVEADSAMQDSANGLLWLYSQTKNAVYLDVAAKLWMDAWSHQPDVPESPGLHGAILQGINPHLQATVAGIPTDRKHLQHDPSLIARSSMWSILNHIFASKRLLAILAERHP